MKKTIALTISILALTACGTKTVYVVTTDAPTTDAPVTTVKVPETTDAPIAEAWTAEDEFIFDIEQNYGNTIYLSDSELFDAGYGTCDALKSGATAYDVLDTITTSADGDLDIELLLTSVVASAIINLCPEQEYKFQE